MHANNYPEHKNLRIIEDSNNQKYQMLIGMVNWVVSIRNFDIAYYTASLLRFPLAPGRAI